MAVKVYSKDRTSASKLRAIKREAAMMVYLSKKRCGGLGFGLRRRTSLAYRVPTPACSLLLPVLPASPPPPPNHHQRSRSRPD